MKQEAHRLKTMGSSLEERKVSGKREINGVFMIPFGLVAGFADGQEIRITEIAEHGFCFRTLDEIREVKGFRICFYDGFNGLKAGSQEKKSGCLLYTSGSFRKTGKSRCKAL